MFCCCFFKDMIFGKVSSEFSTRGLGDAGFVKSFQTGDFRLQGRHARIHALMHSFIHSTKIPPSNQLPATPGLSSKNSFIHSCHKYSLTVCCESRGLGSKPGTTACGGAGGDSPGQSQVALLAISCLLCALTSMLLRPTQCHLHRRLPPSPEPAGTQDRNYGLYKRH